MHFYPYFKLILIVGLACLTQPADATCPYANGCATLTDSASGSVLGNSYVRCDAGHAIEVREILGSSPFQTDTNVHMKIWPSGGATGCPKPANDLPAAVDMQIADVSGGNFELTLFKAGTTDAITSVKLRANPKLGQAVHWLQGSVANTKDTADYFVYLLDEPAESNQIVKRYRLERFESGCIRQEPVEGKTFVPQSIGLTCPVALRGAHVPFETNSGDGYEPKR